jgi:hypothetical protein
LPTVRFVFCGFISCVWLFLFWFLFLFA